MVLKVVKKSNDDRLKRVNLFVDVSDPLLNKHRRFVVVLLLQIIPFPNRKEKTAGIAKKQNSETIWPNIRQIMEQQNGKKNKERRNSLIHHIQVTIKK